MRFAFSPIWVTTGLWMLEVVLDGTLRMMQLCHPVILHFIHCDHSTSSSTIGAGKALLTEQSAIVSGLYPAVPYPGTRPHHRLRVQ